MPPALLKAHQKLDAAVDKAYESQGSKKSYKSDAERVRLPLRPVPTADEFAACGCGEGEAAGEGGGLKLGLNPP